VRERRRGVATEVKGSNSNSSCGRRKKKKKRERRRRGDSVNTECVPKCGLGTPCVPGEECK